MTGLCWNPGYKDLFAVAYGSCKCNFKDNYVRTSLNHGISYNDLLHLPLSLAYISDSFNEHTKQMENKSRGMACVFSLKNPTFPEYICLSSCAILCLDVNPYHPHMLAVGLMNGNVAVYNLQIKTKHPTYISDSINGKHRNLINQVTNPREEIRHKQYLLF